MAKGRAAGNGNGGNLGFEAELFKAADKLRGSMEPSEVVERIYIGAGGSVLRRR